jgi:hypothetical protein
MDETPFTPPGQLDNPFGSPVKPITTSKSKATVERPFVSPGQLANPFGKRNIGRQESGQTSTRTKFATPNLLSRKAVVENKEIKADFYLSGASKWLLEMARKEQSLSDDDIQSMLDIAAFVPKIADKTTTPTEGDIEVGMLLKNETTIRHIIETGATDFDPVRRWDMGFADMTKKQRQQVWVMLAKEVLVEIEKGKLEQ